MYGKFLKIRPICSESYGVRSFCIEVTTPDLSILLDPGCALGPYRQVKMPHQLEFEKLHDYTAELVERSQNCDYLFISHYHHDHFKPCLTDDIYIFSSQQVFEKLYTQKVVFCKQYRINTNYNQKQRGQKLHQDLKARNISGIRIGMDSLPTKPSFYQRNCSQQVASLISDSCLIGDTHLIFPREFMHGIRVDAKEICIQPIILAYKQEFLYFFPDVQGMPSQIDLEALLDLIKDLSQIHGQVVSNNQSNHTIAIGGPISYLLRDQQALHLLDQSILHTREIAQNFDVVILDHHLIRDPYFIQYWDVIQAVKKNVYPFNPMLFKDLADPSRIPILEFNRERLFNKEYLEQK